HLGIELRDLPILILAETPNLLAEDHRRIATAFDAAGGVDFLVIDTLAQSMPGGNESSSEDMGRVIARCRALHHATGAMVLLVHHAGKDATRGARGWSGLRAACDLEIEIVRDGGAREAIVTKLKDGEDGARFGFELRTVMLDGDETSCVAVPREGALLRQPGRERPMGAQEIRVVDLLIAMGGSSRKADLVEAAGKEPATSDDARTPSRRREDARRAIKSLARRGAITCDTGGFITNRTETIANA
ncbi:MAG: AAA family ATPase, partial [Burkholderiales bacterium]|nr:AAA family ATPase [Burkholderiales bacterium]